LFLKSKNFITNQKKAGTLVFGGVICQPLMPKLLSETVIQDRKETIDDYEYIMLGIVRDIFKYEYKYKVLGIEKTYTYKGVLIYLKETRLLYDNYLKCFKDEFVTRSYDQFIEERPNAIRARDGKSVPDTITPGRAKRYIASKIDEIIKETFDEINNATTKYLLLKKSMDNNNINKSI